MLSHCITLLLISLLTHLCISDSPPDPSKTNSIQLEWRWGEQTTPDPYHPGNTIPLLSAGAEVGWQMTGECHGKMKHANWHYRPNATHATLSEITCLADYAQDYAPARDFHPSTYYHKPLTGSCSARSELIFTIFRGGSGEKDPASRFIIKVTSICSDANCKLSDMPTVQCLNGPLGQRITYNDKFIDPCFDR